MPRTNDKLARFTLTFPEALDRNLSLYCAQEGISKRKLLADLISQFLTSKGLQPDKKPKKVEIFY